MMLSGCLLGSRYLAGLFGGFNDLLLFFSDPENVDKQSNKSELALPRGIEANVSVLFFFVSWERLKQTWAWKILVSSTLHSIFRASQRITEKNSMYAQDESQDERDML